MMKEAAVKIKNKSRAKNIAMAKKAILVAVLIITSIMMLYPLLYILLGALSSRVEYLDAGILPIPKTFDNSRIENFTILFSVNTIWTALIMTMGRVIFYAGVTLFISTMGGYIFAKLDFHGKKFVFALLMSSMMIPGISLMVPSYILLTRFPLIGGNNIAGQGGYGFIDNPIIMYILGWVSVYNIFLMRQTMLSLGTEYSEAAEVDGASKMRIIFQIYFPLCRPVIAVMIIGLFIGMWNDYLSSLIYLPSLPKFHTIGTKIIQIIEDLGMEGYDSVPNYPRVFGISFIYMLPPVIVFLIFQKQFISGLSMGGVKG